MQFDFIIDIESEIGSALNGAYFEEVAYKIDNLNENSSCAQLVFHKDFINYIDSGKIIDSNGKPVKTIIGTITTEIAILQDSESDGASTSKPKFYRDIREYPFTICFNSAPPDIKNAMLQLTANDGDYILCFYLPKVKGTVHECDTKKIKIGSETYYFKDAGSGVNFYTDEECTTPADSTKINASYGTGTLNPLNEDGVTFSGTAPSGYYPVYYITGADFSTNENKYDIVLEDDFGLYKSVGVSNKGEKLTAVNIPNGTTYIGTDDGYCEIQLTHTEGLLKLSNYEIDFKIQSAAMSILKVAAFPYIKELKDFDFDFQLSINPQKLLELEILSFIKKAKNIVFLGSSGVGKTHLATSIGIAAAKQRISTYFIKCNDLFMQLKKAKPENRLEARLKNFAKYKLLFLYDIIELFIKS